MSEAESNGRSEKEREAEREVRHGNFRGALSLFKDLAASDPANPHYQARIATLEEGLQPMELHHPKAAAGAAARPMESDLQRGEAAANAGDLATAVSCYERVVEAAPENELAQDRLDELRAELAASAPAPANTSEAPAPSPTAPSPRSSGPPPLAEETDPADPIVLLEALLRRIEARRREP